jgi:hypothetical protein
MSLSSKPNVYDLFKFAFLFFNFFLNAFILLLLSLLKYKSYISSFILEFSSFSEQLFSSKEDSLK